MENFAVNPGAAAMILLLQTLHCVILHLQRRRTSRPLLKTCKNHHVMHDVLLSFTQILPEW